MEQATWLRCREELIALLEQLETGYDDAARTRLKDILHGQGGYDRSAVSRARKNLHPKLLLRLDSFERSVFCGPRDDPPL